MLQITGSNSGTWGTDANNNLISPLDSILGGAINIVMSNADITLSISQWQNKFFLITGTLVANVNLILPLSPNASGGTPSVNGHFIVQNATTGNFSVTVKTSQSGGPFLGQQVPQGGQPIALISTSGNILYADGALGVPVGAVMDFAGTTAPPPWLLCFGQSLLTARYAALFTVIGYTYGGAGANFNIPDYRGRATAGKDDMGGSAANRITSGGSGVPGTTLGGTGGNELMQSHVHTGSGNVTDPGHSHTILGGLQNNQSGQVTRQALTTDQSGSTQSATTGITVPTLNIAATGGGSSQNMPPTIMTNKIIFSGA